MMSRLLHAAYVGVSESLSEAMVESPVGSLVPLSPLVPGLCHCALADFQHIS